MYPLPSSRSYEHFSHNSLISSGVFSGIIFATGSGSTDIQAITTLRLRQKVKQDKLTVLYRSGWKKFRKIQKQATMV